MLQTWIGAALSAVNPPPALMEPWASARSCLALSRVPVTVPPAVVCNAIPVEVIHGGKAHCFGVAIGEANGDHFRVTFRWECTASSRT